MASSDNRGSLTDVPQRVETPERIVEFADYCGNALARGSSTDSAGFRLDARRLEPWPARFGHALEPAQVALFETVIPQAGRWVRSWDGPSVVQHGDLRTDNILFSLDPSRGPPFSTSRPCASDRRNGPGILPWLLTRDGSTPLR
jgi:aminoglycoside phosphotransferase (APT) family kinase protein